MQDTPTIANFMYASSTIDPSQLVVGNAWSRVTGQIPAQFGNAQTFDQLFSQAKQEINKTMATTNRRIVQVFIADPNENVPLEKSILYTGSQKLTDLTDTELFFEVPMAEILKSHNEMRVYCIDKEATKRAGKDILLDPVKIRDLKMVVVTVASF